MATIAYNAKTKELFDTVIAYILRDLGMEANVYIKFPRNEWYLHQVSKTTERRITITFTHRNIKSNNGGYVYGYCKIYSNGDCQIEVSSVGSDLGEVINTIAHELKHVHTRYTLGKIDNVVDEQLAEKYGTTIETRLRP